MSSRLTSRPLCILIFRRTPSSCDRCFLSFKKKLDTAGHFHQQHSFMNLVALLAEVDAEVKAPHSMVPEMHMEELCLMLPKSPFLHVAKDTTSFVIVLIDELLVGHPTIDRTSPIHSKSLLPGLYLERCGFLSLIGTSCSF